MSLFLAKDGLMHVHKVWPQISLCSLQILNWIFAKNRLSFNKNTIKVLTLTAQA